MVTEERDGRTWRIGTAAEAAWITSGTSIDRTVTSAIPPVFEAYATIVLPPAGQGQDVHDQAVLEVLSEQSAGQPWWLGYLDTGADDIVFPRTPMVTLNRDEVEQARLVVQGRSLDERFGEEVE